MNELIQTQDSRATIRWKLLTGASALALTAYVSAADVAKAEDAGHSAIWVELGGQMEAMQGLGSPFIAPFMSASTDAGVYSGGTLLYPVTPASDPYSGNIFIAGQKPPRFAFGLDGKISFQPEDSDWVFSAAIRYGRSHANRHIHHQTVQPPAIGTGYAKYAYHYVKRYFRYTNAIADVQMPFEENHAIVDFQAGRDVGLGIFGRNGTSSVGVGVRFAQFTANSSVYANGLPRVDVDQLGHISYGITFKPNFYQYTMHANAARSFKGVGPSLSWNASAALAGNPQDGELTLDWGINAALLFGRQKAKTEHRTSGYHSFFTTSGGKYHYQYRHHVVLTPQSAHSTRSRNVAVPNIGGFAGLSVKYPNFKVSVGYRSDIFLNAMDTGIDAVQKSNLTFNGPYASISIGLGD